MIDIRTGETVPLSVTDDLCYGIKLTSSSGIRLDGFIVKSGNTSTTDIFTLNLDPQNPGSAVFETKAVYGDEDLVASLTADGERIFTTLGKNSLVELATDNQQYRYSRGYALPRKTVILDQFVVTLNYDGSVTWFDKNSRGIISTSSISARGLWIEE
jgi:hypothetical protein